MITLALLLVLQIEGSSPASYPEARASVETIAKGIRECGFDSARFGYDGDMQDDVIFVSHTGDANDASIDCVARLYIASAYWIEMPERLRERFFAATERIGRPAAIARSTKWLRENDLLDGLPQYDPEAPIMETARSFEKHCGVEAKGIFTTSYGSLTISPEWIADGRLLADKEPAFTCILHSAAVTGLPIGFVGNERADQLTPPPDARSPATHGLMRVGEAQPQRDADSPP